MKIYLDFNNGKPEIRIIIEKRKNVTLEDKIMLNIIENMMAKKDNIKCDFAGGYLNTGSLHEIGENKDYYTITYKEKVIGNK